MRLTKSANVLSRTLGVRTGSETLDVPADVAQLVERNLAKVEVASSSLVIRSERVGRLTHPTVEWPRGEATDCKSVYEGSNPFSTSSTTRIIQTHRNTGAIGAAVARFPDTEEVTGSIPVSPTL